MKKTLLLLAALTLSPALYAQDYHVVLWDNATAPTSNGLTGEEIQPKPGQWSNTQKAEMWIYKAGDNATGQALVFFPGGGYSTLSVGNGHKEAKWFAENGVTAAVVKYRLPNGHSVVPRNDADEALRVMREMAAELNIDPAKVGVSGTSAGGYLAGSVGTLSEVKPDFMILYYPVISADATRGRSCNCSAPTMPTNPSRRSSRSKRRSMPGPRRRCCSTATTTRWCRP